MNDKEESAGGYLAALQAENEQLKNAVASRQAKIDELMLEYCPDEMTPEQMEEWEKHQVAVDAPKLDLGKLQIRHARDEARETAKDKKPKSLAARIFDPTVSWAEEDLNDYLVQHLGEDTWGWTDYDPYDHSIELYGATDDMLLPEEVQAHLKEQGFQRLWINHGNFTQTYYNFDKIGPGTTYAQAPHRISTVKEAMKGRTSRAALRANLNDVNRRFAALHEVAQALMALTREAVRLAGDNKELEEQVQRVALQSKVFSLPERPLVTVENQAVAEPVGAGASWRVRVGSLQIAIWELAETGFNSELPEGQAKAYADSLNFELSRDKRASAWERGQYVRGKAHDAGNWSSWNIEAFLKDQAEATYKIW